MNEDFVLSQTDRRPMYLQIMEQIKLRVAAGEWPAGHKLPSIRRLSINLRVSVITVKRAYLELEREGVIVTQHGKGSWIASDRDLATSLQQDELDELLEKAARLALALGLSPEDLRERLSRVFDQLKKDTP